MEKKIVKDKSIPNLKESVACIGYFDGVHIGHQKLIKETIKQAKKLNCLSTLICFDPDPADLIYGTKNKHLTTFKDRLNIIELFGIDQIIVIVFDEKFMQVSASSFIKDYLNKMNIKKLICGYDFSFGYKAKGNIETLQKNSKFETIVIPEFKYRNKKVSTTLIKQELFEGNFKLVDKLLGYDYAMELVVLNSIKKGKKWLIEAKPRDKYCVLPKDGMYAYGFEVKEGNIYLLGNSKLNKGQILITSFSKDE